MFVEKKKLKKKYIRPRYFYHYYFTVRKRTFRKYIYKAKKLHGSFIKNYLTLLEGRLFMVIFRSAFVTNIFKLKSIIERGIFLVNGIKRFHVNFHVRVGDLVQVDFKLKNLLINDIKIRIRRKRVLPFPRYNFFINYQFMFIFFLRSPKLKDINLHHAKFEYGSKSIQIDPYIGGDIYYL